MAGKEQNDKKVSLIEQGRMFEIVDVLKMWPVSRSFIARMIKDKSDRLPSYRVRGKRLFRYDELTWFMDKHKEE